MQEQVKQAIKAVFEALKDFQKEITYTHEEMGEFDPETGSVSQVSISATLDAIVRSYKDFIVNNSNGNILASDRKVMFSPIDLAITPTVNDIVKVDGVDYLVMDVKSDLSGSLWILQTRKS